MNPHIKTCLAVSIILNVLLAGIVLGDFSHRLLTPQSDKIAARLPENKRHLYEEIMIPAHKDMETARTNINAEKAKAIKLLMTESFEPAAYMMQVQRIAALYAQMKHKMAESVVRLAKQFTPEERILLAEIISHSSSCSMPAQQPSTQAAVR